MKTKKPQEAKAFLEKMIARVDARLKKLVATKSAGIARSMEGLYAAGADGTALSDPVKQLIISSNVYAKGEFYAFELSSEPDVYIEKKSKAMILIVATMASLFASVLIVFMAEAFNNMRNDPVSSEKIIAAMKDKPSIRKTFTILYRK